MTAGAKQWLDASTPGALAETAPADKIKAGIAKAADILFVDIDAIVDETQTGGEEPPAPAPSRDADIGDIKEKAGKTTPPGWLPCDGRAVSRTTFADLFEEIGEAYGAGDGSTTFNLPNKRGRVSAGVNHAGLPNGADASLSTRNEGDTTGTEEETLTISQSPEHNHTVSDWGHTGPGNTSFGGSDHGVELGVNDRTTSSAGGGEGHNNMQPTLFTPFYIYSGVVE